MTSRIRIATCLGICCLLLALVVSVAIATPVLVWDESPNGEGDGNVYYGGAVTAGQYLTSQLAGNGPQLWSDEQVGGTALVQETLKDFPSPNPAYLADDLGKSAVIIGGYIYSNVGGQPQIYQSNGWAHTGGLNQVSGIPTTPECMCTDGTAIYMTSGSSANYNKVYKLDVTATGGTYGGGSVAVAAGWPITISTATRFRGISCYNNKLYLLDFTAANANVYEVDCVTGGVSTLCTAGNAATGSNYQIVRYGNQMFSVGLDGFLRTFTLIGSTWTATGVDNLNSVLDTQGGGHTGGADLYGIGVTGDGTTAKHAWINRWPGHVAFLNISAPEEVWKECPYGTGAGSIYYIGGVYGDHCYTGQISHSAQEWGDAQVGGTAIVNQSTAGGMANWAKASLPLGGYIYSTNGANDMRRQSAWSATSEAVLPAATWSPDDICTDGTYIYGTQGSSGAGGPDTNKIYKWSINHATNTLTNVWTVTQGTASTHRFRSLSCLNGKLYAVNHKAGGEIYEVDCVTGVLTQIASVSSTALAYQCARYGNDLFVVGLDGNLVRFTLSGTWSQTAKWALPYPHDSTYGLFGIGLKGDGVTARYAWITTPYGQMSFWDLIPGLSSGKGLAGLTWQGGFPASIEDGIVTAQFASDASFWVENKDRTVGARVSTGGAMPGIGNRVSITGTQGKSASGEKTLTATTVGVGSPQDPIEPLFVTNKALGTGLATDGMLVKVCGNITGSITEPVVAFYIDDGSGIASDTVDVKGVKISHVLSAGADLADIYESFAGGGYAVVTGIVRYDKVGSDPVTYRVDPLSLDSIVITAP